MGGNILSVVDVLLNGRIVALRLLGDVAALLAVSAMREVVCVIG